MKYIHQIVRDVLTFAMVILVLLLYASPIFLCAFLAWLALE